MSDIGQPQKHDGYVYTIISYEEHSQRACPSNCYYIRNKEACYYEDEFRKDCIDHKKHVFHCVEIKVNVKNCGPHEDWFLGPEDIKLVDNEGFVYSGHIPACKSLKDARMLSPGSLFMRGTQSNYIEFFPSLPDGAHVKCFLVDVHHKRFVVRATDEPDEEGLLEEQFGMEGDAAESAATQDNNNLKWDLENARRSINRIKTQIYERTHNTLTSSEITKLENRIRSDFYSLLLDLESKNLPEFQELMEEVKSLENDYKQQVDILEGEEQAKRDVALKIEELQQLTPREFEEYIAQLFEALGYWVETTPLVNDKGTDIIMFKDNTKYAVQCKRYKGTVGSPEIQTFLGSMTHYNADKGYFVTTGMFSFDAENLAKQHPITLLNKIDLAQLITEVLEKKQSHDD